MWGPIAAEAEGGMREILRTSDAVRLSWLTALLADRRIDAVVLDMHMSVLEGSANAIPRRLMVVDEDYAAAVGLLEQAGELDGKTSPYPVVAPSDDRADHVLGGRVIIHQPSGGYRSAIDPVLLAAAVPDVNMGSVLDVGSGVGTAALCYAERARDARVTGLEVQPQLGQLAEHNIEANGVGARVRIIVGDLLNPPSELQPASYDEVMANPPYLQAGHANSSPDEVKAVSTIEGPADLACWVRFCLKMVKPYGGITFIHRADRLDELLALLVGYTGGIVIFPFWPMAGQPAKRVIVHARCGAKAPLRLSAGMVLHAGANKLTAEAEEVLRSGAALNL